MRSADRGFDERDLETLPVAPDACAVTFTVDLPAGSRRLATIFTTADGRAVGCYYVVVTAGE